MLLRQLSECVNCMHGKRCVSALTHMVTAGRGSWHQSLVALIVLFLIVSWEFAWICWWWADWFHFSFDCFMFVSSGVFCYVIHFICLFVVCNLIMFCVCEQVHFCCCCCCSLRLFISCREFCHKLCEWIVQVQNKRDRVWLWLHPVRWPCTREVSSDGSPNRGHSVLGQAREGHVEPAAEAVTWS